ncbi:hypothetical protein IMSAGC002_03768 [Lachnospiraceae bacterium]|mgnify:CR=1 FL=1|jgi:hypothetical protein|nr:hypothetical protein IMSAGC002_03768 [Lachnospiraceae bacterium]
MTSKYNNYYDNGICQLHNLLDRIASGKYIL